MKPGESKNSTVERKPDTIFKAMDIFNPKSIYDAINAITEDYKVKNNIK
jgi:threonine synthase